MMHKNEIFYENHNLAWVKPIELLELERQHANLQLELDQAQRQG